MEIKVLGSGCASCKKLEKNVLEALEVLNQTSEVEKITEMSDIMSYGVMQTPALVINNRVVLQGQVPNVKQLVKIIEKQI